MIRTAATEELPAVLELLKPFSAHMEKTLGVEADEQDEIAALGALQQDGLLLVDDQMRGVIGAMVFPLFLNTDVLIAQELFWWVKPEARKLGVGDDLMDALEHFAKQRGCKLVFMMDLATSPESAERVFLKRGYAMSERHWIKRI